MTQSSAIYDDIMMAIATHSASLSSFKRIFYNAGDEDIARFVFKAMGEGTLQGIKDVAYSQGFELPEFSVEPGSYAYERVFAMSQIETEQNTGVGSVSNADVSMVPIDPVDPHTVTALNFNDSQSGGV